MEISALQIWQGTLNGLALGGVYILMALGLTLIFGITRIMQFAHGEVYMLGAYVVFFLTASYRLNVFLAMLISIAAMAVLGLFLERFLFRPVQGQILPPIVASIGLTLVLQSAVLVQFGIFEKSLPRLAEGSVTFLGGAVPLDRVQVVGFAVALVVFMYGFLRVSKYGQAIVASAQNPLGAVLQGISPNQMSALSMAIACALAGAGGALAGSLFRLQPYMGTLPMVKGLVIIVLGGMGSLPGVVVGGVILGLIDGVVPIVAGTSEAAVLPLLMVIALLLVKPQGLLGHE